MNEREDTLTNANSYSIKDSDGDNASEESDSLSTFCYIRKMVGYQNILLSAMSLLQVGRSPLESTTDRDIAEITACAEQIQSQLDTLMKDRRNRRKQKGALAADIPEFVNIDVAETSNDVDSAPSSSITGSEGDKDEEVSSQILLEMQKYSSRKKIVESSADKNEHKIDSFEPSHDSGSSIPDKQSKRSFWRRLANGKWLKRKGIIARRSAHPTRHQGEVVDNRYVHFFFIIECNGQRTKLAYHYYFHNTLFSWTCSHRTQ